MCFFFRPAPSRASGDPQGLFLELSYFQGNKCFKIRSVWFGEARLLIFLCLHVQSAVKIHFTAVFLHSWPPRPKINGYGWECDGQNIKHRHFLSWYLLIYDKSAVRTHFWGRPIMSLTSGTSKWWAMDRIKPYIKLCQCDGQKHQASPFFQLIFTYICQISC